MMRPSVGVALESALDTVAVILSSIGSFDNDKKKAQRPLRLCMHRARL